MSSIVYFWLVCLMTCSICNYLSKANDRFCTQCGHALFHFDAPRADVPRTDVPRTDVPRTDGSSAICLDGKMPSLQDRPVDLVRSHQLAGISDRGRWHSQNEDAIAVEHLESDRSVGQSVGQSVGRSVLIVCDGVSSSTHPENASATAATIVALALADDVATSLTSCPKATLASAIRQAQQAVARLAEPDPNNPSSSDPSFDSPSSSNQCLRNPPATTIVAAVIQTDDQAKTLATIGWLGDSRAYWIAHDTAQLLTRDDSWLNAIRISGKLSEAEALRSPYVHAITRWLGANADHLPSLIQVPLDQAGYLILCSDGFWNYAAEPDRVAELCQRSPLQSAHTIAQILVHHALSCGGRDNISVAVYYHEP